MDNTNPHYRAGYRRAWLPRRKDLGAEEDRYRAMYGDAAWASFVDGWMDSLEEN